ncbi:hypothetical protein HPB47_009561 [Ixodes persulcatus]|uniref:Uncharacterized protein n=1 Tax=Ixodes persulcatus TaxID=34615 RepID=A0AC60P1V4_IXOPE|nr:hypothetical protein HPB47_009561 [Ixodes persulcatus]
MIVLKSTPTPKGVASGLCTSRECHELAVALEASRNQLADPCDDFYEFVCGNYTNPKGSVFQQVEEAILRSVSEKLGKAGEHRSRQQDVIGYTLEKLHRSCMRVSTSDNSGAIKLFMDSLQLGLHENVTLCTLRSAFSLSFEYKLETQFSVELLDVRPESNQSFYAVGFNPRYTKMLSKRKEQGIFEKVALMDTSIEAYGSISSDAKRDLILRILDVEHTVKVLFTRYSNLKPSNTVMVPINLEDLNKQYSGSPSLIQYIRELLRKIGYKGLTFITAWDVLRSLAPMASSKAASLTIENDRPSRCLSYVLESLEMPVGVWHVANAMPSVTLESAFEMARRIHESLKSLAVHTMFAGGGSNNNARENFFKSLNQAPFLSGNANISRKLEEFYRTFPEVSGKFLGDWLQSSRHTASLKARKAWHNLDFMNSADAFFINSNVRKLTFLPLLGDASLTAH